jgi:hypothetical protein
MYAWIWRRLPFGLPGKLAGTLVLATAVAALLWYVVFPWAEPLLPFDDVQVTQEGGVPGEDPGFGTGGDPGVGSTPDPRESGLDEHDIPYSTETDNPAPEEDD